MPYLGDAPTNPIPLTLSGGAASGAASGGSDHDRHVAWFSIPAQAAGKSVLLQTLVGVGVDANFDVCILWEGGVTAHYGGYHSSGARQDSIYRPIPAGVAVLVGVFPKGVERPTQSTSDGTEASGSARTVAQWESAIPVDLTRRLPVSVNLSVVVENTVAPSGSAANPQVISFLSSQAPVTVDFTNWAAPDLGFDVTLPAGYALKATDAHSGAWPGLNDPAAAAIVADGFSIILRPSAGTLSVERYAGASLPTGNLVLTPIHIGDLSGSAVDTDGVSVEPCNVLLFRINDAFRAVQAPSGVHSITDVPEGDYIAVAFSQLDARDVRATNVMVPPGTRVAGGSYPFVIPGG